MAWVTGIDGVRKNLAALYTGERKAIALAMGEIASLLKNAAKANHPWTARTGNTDLSTDAKIVTATVEEIVVALWAGMSYDVFLELARDGRWSWLWPTMMACEEQIVQILIKHCGLDGVRMAGGMVAAVRATGL